MRMWLLIMSHKGSRLNNTVSYDIFAITLASTMLGYVYGTTTESGLKALSTSQELGIKVATPVGTLIGQLLFGWLADRIGRKKMCELTTLLTT